MSDDMLSQDEIDALLNGGGDTGSNKDSDLSPKESHLAILEEDALGEIGNISFGSSATALSSLLNQKVEITTPEIAVVYRKDLADEFPKPHVAVGVTYTDGFTGENVFVMKTKDAAIIADLMLGGDGLNPDENLNEIALSAVQEAMNQMMGSAATSMSTIFNKKVDISPPSINVLDLEDQSGEDMIPEEETLVNVAFQLKIGTLIDSKIMQLIPLNFAKDLVEQLLDPEGSQTSEPNISDEKQVLEQTGPSSPEEPQSSSGTSPDREVTEFEQHQADPQYVGGPAGRSAQEADVQHAQFQQFEQSPSMTGTAHKNLDMLMDIPLKVTVELGRTKRTVKDILELSAGSVVELDKLAGEPVDIHVNEKLMAKGEVVVIDENFGVRVTDILSPKDRLTKLR